MMIWVVFACMVALAMLFLLPPLLRPAATAAPRAEYDLAVYKDQLAEIGRDVERGLLTPDQAEAARTEVQRRMLSLAEGKEPGKAKPAGKGVVAAVALVVPMVAFGLYFMLGAPWLPDQPFSARKGEIAQAQGQAAQIQAMVDQLAGRLKQNPNDGKGWAMLGRSYRVLGRPDDAVEAFKKAAELLPQDVPVRLELAGLLSETMGLGPDLVRVLKEILALDPNQPDALYFMGYAESQIGNNAKARDYWNRLLKQLPKDAPERAELVKALEQLK